ncbi:MAG: SPOR domain-containing protein [bacterium]|nr:SPOR domain-containing protein [bacterium]
MAEDRVISGLPYHLGSPSAAPTGFAAGPAFWSAVAQRANDDLLADRLDDLLDGATVPRTWLVLNEPGQAATGAVAALMLARALLARGQNVLVLDVDESAAALTEWAGRRQTEGWIDVARFGASVPAAAAVLPFRGGRGALLGVGSFTPTDVTEDEIISLHGRLRHQADDILFVGTVGPDVLPWARRAERRLYCWDLSARTEADLGRVLGPFAAEGVPVTGILGWGTEPEITGDLPAVEPVEVEAAPAPAAPVPEPVAPRVNGPVPPRPVTAPAFEELATFDAEPEPARRNPRLFWLAAAAFGAAIVASTWYWSNYVRVPPGGFFEPVATQEQPPGSGGVSPAPGPELSRPLETPSTAEDTATGALPPRVAEAGGLASLGDTLPKGTDTPVRAGDAVTPAGASATGPFDRAAFAVPVGRDGWALHVYSLADSASAAEQIAALASQGFRTAVRIVEIREKGGRWWRIYVGSFPTRAAAAAAMPALLGHLKAGWAEPARIHESSP